MGIPFSFVQLHMLSDLEKKSSRRDPKVTDLIPTVVENNGENADTPCDLHISPDRGQTFELQPNLGDSQPDLGEILPAVGGGGLKGSGNAVEHNSAIPPVMSPHGG